MMAGTAGGTRRGPAGRTKPLLEVSEIPRMRSCRRDNKQNKKQGKDATRPYSHSIVPGGLEVMS